MSLAKKEWNADLSLIRNTAIREINELQSRLASMEEAKAEWENKLEVHFLSFFSAITGFYNMQIMGETLWFQKNK